MVNENTAVAINNCNNCTLVTVNTNTIPTIPSIVTVTDSRRKKLRIIISMIIAGVLIAATIVILPTVLLKKTSATTTEETTTVTTRTATEVSETTRTRMKKTTITKRTAEIITTTTTENDGTGIAFHARKSYSTKFDSLPVGLAVVDVNNDKKPDIIVANQRGHNVGVLLNTGNGKFSSQTIYSTTEYSHPQYVSVVDINGDDKPDLIVALNGANGIGILFNTGNGTFLPQQYYTTGEDSYPPSLTVADINHDQKPDIIVANQNKNNIEVFFNSGDGTFRYRVKYEFSHGVGLTSPVVADVNDDSNPDLIFANYNADSVTVLFNIGNGTFVSSATYLTGKDSRPQFLSVADVNQDDTLDIIVANSEKMNVGIFLNSGNGTFLPQTTYSTGNDSDPRCVSVVDLNGDNKPEIIVVNRDANNIGILINFGNGTFLLQKTYSTGLDSSPRFVSVVDVNDDDKPDIIVANSHKANVGVMLAA